MVHCVDFGFFECLVADPGVEELGVLGCVALEEAGLDGIVAETGVEELGEVEDELGIVAPTGVELEFGRDSVGQLG